MTTPSNVSQRVKAFNAFISADKVQVKYSLMAQNAYRFFRGTCHLFYEDLSIQKDFPHQSPHIWGCGDLHLENFGSYKGRNGYVYFDQNDFDEAMLMPATWELSRVVTSIIVAFRALNVNDERITAWTRRFLNAYCKRLKTGKAKHIEERLAKGIVRDFLETADRRSQRELLRKLTVRQKNKFVLLNDEKHEAINGQNKAALLTFLNNWLRSVSEKDLRPYRAIDACHRTAGTGSVGVKRYLLLLQSADEKFLLLDMKEARYSALRSFNAVMQPQWASEAGRVVAIQSRSQYATTARLNSVDFDGLSFTVRELQPEDDKLDFTLVVQNEKDTLRVLKDIAMLTASAHLRSAGRQGSAIADELIQFGNDSSWQEALLQYAVNYAGKVNTDYEAFLYDYQNGFFATNK